MSLDDRLRGAYRRQLEDVQQRVAADPVVDHERQYGSSRPLVPRPAGRLLAVAAAIGLILAGAAVLNRVLADTEVSSLQTEAADDGNGLEDGPTDGDEPVANSEPTTAAPTDTTPTTDVDTGPRPESSVGTATTTQAVSPSTGPSTSPSTGQQPEQTTAPPATVGSSSSNPQTSQALGGGVPNDVCPSGLRAELEWAALRYVGENRGWGRKDDLVDEQDGPFYFQAWEPNYDLPVSVEILLTEPVLATDVRVAQDPFTPVAGIITVEAADQRLEIALSGTEGWRVHTFDVPTVIDRLTIGRDGRDSNIMEVLLCVAAPG